MNFEDAFKHYQDGTATEEEREYVQGELAKAKAFGSLFDDDEGLIVTPAPVKEADAWDIKSIKKYFSLKYLVYSVVSVVIILLSIASILGGVFGSAASYAKSNIKYGEFESIQSAKIFAYDFLENLNGAMIGSPENIVVLDVDSDFNYNARNIKNSYYAYKVEMEIGVFVIEILVDTRFENVCQIENLN